MAERRKKFYGPALASTLVAGLGQVLKGDARKGLKLMLWFYMGLPIILVGSLLLNAYLFLVIFAIFVILYPAIWIMNIFDAYSSQRLI